MMLVKTKVGKSPIHGLGVFADEFIPRGTLIFRFVEPLDKRFNKEEVLSFPKEIQIYLSKYSWVSTKSGLVCVPFDNNKYINHSTAPNVISEYKDGEPEVVSYAICDINPGEELTEDYAKFEDINIKGHVLNEIVKKYHLVDEADPRLKPLVNSRKKKK